MMRKFVLVTDGTDAGAHEGLSPMGFNPLFTVLGKPLEGIPPNLALTIGVGVCRSRCRSARARGWFAFLVNLDEPIIEHRIGHNGIKGGSFIVFRTRTELLDNTFVATVKSTDKEQNHQKWRNDYPALIQFEREAVKTGPILKNGLILSLNVIEKGQERGECISNGVWTTMLHESGKHFEATAMVLGTLVLE